LAIQSGPSSDISDVYRTGLKVYRTDFHLRVKACKFVSPTRENQNTEVIKIQFPKEKPDPKKNQQTNPIPM
jgi:hypothetical protein